MVAQAQNPKREFRGAWIATVENIDWPSKAGLSTQAQQLEFINLLDNLKAAGLNAIIVQIRAASDAFYPSPFEPWSTYLNGVMDQQPDPYYDPLQFMIQETHRRSMEFHAWLNPYRALNNSNTSSLSSNHPMRQHPDWFLKYGEKYYFNPGNPESKKHILKVIENIVSRYNIDALHFDDYFYPYKIAGKEFPDLVTFQYGNRGFTNIDDWRRDNVNTLIEEIHSLVKKIKPALQLGISPFGVWRNMDKDPVRGSPTKAGQTNYDDLYADILLWIEKGWIDYIIPQLYFPLGFDLIDPEVMMKWWAENAKGIPVYIGKGLYRVGSNRKGWDNPDEIPNQIKLSRKINDVSGSAYFSAKWFLSNPLQVVDRMKSDLYNTSALLPSVKNSNLRIPEKPEIVNVKSKRKYVSIEWGNNKSAKPYYYVIYRFNGKKRGNLNDASRIKYISPFNPKRLKYFDQKGRKGNYYTYVVVPVNRHHYEGIPSNPITVKFR